MKWGEALTVIGAGRINAVKSCAGVSGGEGKELARCLWKVLKAQANRSNEDEREKRLLPRKSGGGPFLIDCKRRMKRRY